MPAAAVIPAPIAYTKVVAVKKLVVGFLVETAGRHLRVFVPGVSSILGECVSVLNWMGTEPPSFTVSKIECSKQA